jgi:hypothetical protein
MSTAATEVSSSSSLSVSTQPLIIETQESKFEYSYDDPKKLDTLLTSKGIFAFSLFRNVRDLRFAARAYTFKEGIKKYIELTKREQFKGWVVLVYVDASLFDFSDLNDPKYIEEQTIKELNDMYDNQFNVYSMLWTAEKKKREITKFTGYVKKTFDELVESTKELTGFLQSEANCILCKYTFPKLIVPNTSIHYNFVGSMARFHALQKFSDRRVCVRDADTYFPSLWHYKEDLNNSRYSTREPFMTIAKKFVDLLEQWEVNLLKVHTTKNLPFLIAYDTPYIFHNFRKKPTITVTRLLAGIVDSLEHNPDLFTAEDWDKGLQFVQEESTLYNIRGSKNVEFNTDGKYIEKSRNNFKKNLDATGTTYYGCDEKILRYIFFEKWRNQTVLFYFPYAFMGSNLMYSNTEDEDSFLNKYEKILQESVSSEEKKSPLYAAVDMYIKHYREMNSYTKYQQRTPPGQFYFLFQTSFPLFSEKLALEVYGKIPDNIKGGFRKSKKSRKNIKRATEKSRKKR